MTTKKLLHDLTHRMASLNNEKKKWEERYNMDNPATALLKLVEDSHDWFDFTTMAVIKEIPAGTDVIMYVDTMGEWLNGIVRGYVHGDSNYGNHFIVQEEDKAVYEAIPLSYVAPRGIVDYVEAIEAILTVELPDMADHIYWALPVESDLGKVQKVHLMKKEGVALVEIYNGVTIDKLLYKLDGTPLFIQPSQASLGGLYLRNTKSALEEARNHITRVFFSQDDSRPNSAKYSEALRDLIVAERAVVPTRPSQGVTLHDAKVAISYLTEPLSVINHIPDENALRLIVNSFGFAYDDSPRGGQSIVYPCTFRVVDDARYTVSSYITHDSRYGMAYSDFMDYVRQSAKLNAPRHDETSGSSKQSPRQRAVMSFPVGCTLGSVGSVNKLDTRTYSAKILTVATMAYQVPLEVSYDDTGAPLNKGLAQLEQFLLTNQTPTLDHVKHYIENAIHSMHDTVDKTAEDIVANLQKVGVLLAATDTDSSKRKS